MSDIEDDRRAVETLRDIVHGGPMNAVYRHRDDWFLGANAVLWEDAHAVWKAAKVAFERKWGSSNA